MPCHQIFSFVIMAVLHHTANGIAIYMHICRAHKNAYLYALVIKIFFLNNFFYSHNFSISGAHYFVFTYFVNTSRNSKKRNNKKEQEQRNKKNYHRRHRCRAAQKSKRNKVNKSKQ